MEYKLHISDGNVITNSSKELCLVDAKRLGYQLFDTVKQEQVIRLVTREDGSTYYESVFDDNHNPVMQDVTHLASHTFTWGNLDQIKADALEHVSAKCIENRRIKYMTDDSQTNALAGIYEQGSNPKKINGLVLTKQKAVEIINAHRDFYYLQKSKIDLCKDVDEVSAILNNLIFP